MNTGPGFRGLSAVALAVMVLAPAVADAGTVDVAWRTEPRYRDAGDHRSDEERNLRILADHLRALGERQLPSGQTLQLELVEVDLAGETWPAGRGGQEVRIARGGVDAPRITLRYALKGADGALLSSGEETVRDLTYLERTPSPRTLDPLGHEKRMLQEWFSARFGTPPR